jgi:DNA-binding NtrC family response regulator
MTTILIVEDKESMAEMLSQALEAEGYSTLHAKDGGEGIQLFKDKKIDLVLTDLKLPQKDGLEVLAVVKAHNPLTPVIMMTAYGTIETAVKAVKEGAYDFLTKPFDPDHLLILIAKALEKQRLVTKILSSKMSLQSNSKDFPELSGRVPKSWK